MITMGGFTLPQRTIREMIGGSIDVSVQASRLRDGTRKIVSITEIMGLEGDVIVTQDIMRYEIDGEDKDGRLNGSHRGTGIGRPRCWERARDFNMDADLGRALDALEEGGRG
jgi:pilus assembly protein CpaF